MKGSGWPAGQVLACLDEVSGQVDDQGYVGVAVVRDGLALPGGAWPLPAAGGAGPVGTDRLMYRHGWPTLAIVGKYWMGEGTSKQPA